MANKPEFDEVDLNRLYAALEYQLNFAGPPRAEVRALMELRDRIGEMLEGEEEDPGCGSDCCGASCICHAR